MEAAHNLSPSSPEEAMDQLPIPSRRHPAAAANKDHPDLLVHPETWESPAVMDQTERTETMVATAMCSRVPSRTSLASSAHQDHPETKELADKKDPEDPRALPERTARTATKEMPVSKDPLDFKDPSDHPDRPALSALPDDSSRSTAQLAHKEHPVHQEPQARRALPDKTEPTAAAESDHPEIWAHPAHKVPLDLKAHPAHLDPTEKVEAANTALRHALLQAIRLFIGGLDLYHHHYYHHHHHHEKTKT